MRTCEDIRLRHPGAWETAHEHAAAKDHVQESRWRWELIRRSNLYRQQADSCRAGQWPSLELLGWSWGLPCPPGGRDSGELYLDHGADFTSLVVAIALDGMDLDSDGRLILPTGWRDRITETAKDMGHQPEGPNLPPGVVKAHGQFDHIPPLVHATWTVTVTPPDGCHPWRITQQLAAAGLEWTHIPPEVHSDQITVKLIRQLPADLWHRAWPFAPGSAFIPETDLLKIADAVSAAMTLCGTDLPVVELKKPGGRLRDEYLHNQVTALDVAEIMARDRSTGKKALEQSKLDLVHWTRTLKTAQERINKLEASAKQRQEAIIMA